MSQKGGASAKGEMGGTWGGARIIEPCALRLLCASRPFRISRSSRILDASRAFLAFPARRARGGP